MNWNANANKEAFNKLRLLPISETVTVDDDDRIWSLVDAGEEGHESGFVLRSDHPKRGRYIHWKCRLPLGYDRQLFLWPVMGLIDQGTTPVDSGRKGSKTDA